MLERTDSPDVTTPDGREVAPYGSWRSPVTAKLMAEGGVSTMWPQSAGESLYWTELRPLENGRYVVVRRAPDGEIADVTPPGVSARTLVHEYGGGMYVAFLGADGAESVIFSDQADQRLYRQDLRPAGSEPAGEARPARWSDPRPLTPAPPAERAHRYADGRVTPDGRLLVTVRERHEASGDVVNELVSLPTDGSAEPRVIASGHDFYAAPRLSPDGRRLAWLSWDHPRMPWDGTELWTAELAGDGTVSGERLVAGGPRESILQPLWSPAGELWFASDRTGWWNLYAVAPGREARRAEVRQAMRTTCRSPARWAPATPSSSRSRGSLVCNTTSSSPTGPWPSATRRTAATTSPSSTRRRGGQSRGPRGIGPSRARVALQRRLLARPSRRPPRPRRRHAHRRAAGRHRRPAHRRARAGPPRPPHPHRAGVHQPPRGDRLPHRGRPQRARQLLPAGQSGLRGAGRRAAAAAGQRARRPDFGTRGDARPRHPVLDEPRLRRGRRQLRRAHGLRPRVPGAAAAASGGSSTSTTPSTPRATSSHAATPTPSASAFAAGAPAATRRWRAHPSDVFSAGASLFGVATWRRFAQAARTSSSRAISTA